jgi:transposase
LGSHKSAAVREAIEAAGATRWLLPPYSPDLDPIEQVFAKLKTNYEKWRNEPSTPSGTPSLSSLRTSPQPNASTISATQDTVRPKEDTL